MISRRRITAFSSENRFGILPRPGGIFFSPDSFSGSSFYLSTAEFRDEKGLNDTILSLSLIKFLRALHPLQF